MGRVAIGMKQRDDDALRAGRAGLRDRARDARFFELCLLRAVRLQPPCDAEGCVELLDPIAANEKDTAFLALYGEALLRTNRLDRSREMFEEMNRGLSQSRLKPVIDRVFPFAEAPDAFRYLESGAHFGKVVIAV